MAMDIIAVNQWGYVPEADKMAFVVGEVNEFTVLDARTDAVVYRAGAQTTVPDSFLAGKVSRLSFSAVRRSGEYYIRVPDGRKSVKFRVGSHACREILERTMRSYTLQRCGLALNDVQTGIRHGACHTAPVQLRADPLVMRELTGGWHDAGDYGRYTQTAAVASGQLLLMAEWAPRVVEGINLNLPDHMDRMPDILTEVAYELRWLRKMQRTDGAVYHKVNTPAFCGMVLPEDDRETQLLYDPATPDTAIFAAAMARAARVYRPYDREFAGHCLRAALLAWDYLLGAEPFLDPPNDGTGEYRSQSDQDERLWAAVELFLTTGEAQFRLYVEVHYDEVVTASPGNQTPNWNDVSLMAALVLAGAPDLAWGIQQGARKLLLQGAEQLVRRLEQDPYFCALLPEQYVWGSAKSVAAYGINLLAAYRLDGDQRYLQAAQRQLDWVIGANHLAQSYITGMGERSARYPHNRYAVAAGILVPGLVVGGPNQQAFQQDNVTPKRPGPLSYIDSHAAYASNENAIDYNAPVVILAALLQDAYAGVID